MERVGEGKGRLNRARECWKGPVSVGEGNKVLEMFMEGRIGPGSVREDQGGLRQSQGVLEKARKGWRKLKRVKEG